MIKLKIHLYADGANLKDIKYFNNKKNIKGLTTNPSLMKKSGVKNYKKFAMQVLKIVKKKPISFEVFSDNLVSMHNQALAISSWGTNVFVKIPVTNTKGKSCCNLIRNLSEKGVKVNVTAVFTKKQIRDVIKVLDPSTPSILSIFCGRIADAGFDPVPLVRYALKKIKKNSKIKILWASTRELYNIVEANKTGCHIITVPTDILKKITTIGKSLSSYSLETVKMFYKDAKSSGFKI